MNTIKTAMMISTMLCAAAFARIGETPNECAARYGAGSAPAKAAAARVNQANGNGSASFSKPGLSVSVEFKDWKAVRITFYSDSTLSDADIAQILKVNCGRSDFQNVPQTFAFPKGMKPLSFVNGDKTLEAKVYRSKVVIAAPAGESSPAARPAKSKLSGL